MVQKCSKIDFGDLEFDIVFIVRTPYWEVLGGFPKRQKYGCFFRTLPTGVQRCTYGPKVVKRVEHGNPKGLQHGAKSDTKEIPKTRPHSYGTLWVPIGGPEALLGGFGDDFWWILGRFLEDSGAHFLYV